MKKTLLTSILFAVTFLTSNAQSPTFFSSGNYANPNNWSQGSATSMGTIVSTNILTTTPNGSGNQYFRFYSATSGGTTYEPNGGSDIQITSGATPVSLQVTGSGKAYYLNIVSGTSNVVFKTVGSGTPGTSRLFAVEVQGTIRTISSVAQSPSTVYNGQTALITATLSGTLSTGQGVYIRYTTDNFATSTVQPMSVTGTSATYTIPSFSAGTTVKYYTFSSGTTTPSGADADLCTINYN